MDWCLLVEGEYKLYHSVWEPPIMCVAWKIPPSLGCYVDNGSIPLKILFTSVSKTKENTYATLLHHPFLFGENQRCPQEVVGEYKLYHSAWEPPIMCVAWKISRSLGCYVDNESIPLKILFISISKSSSGTSTKPCFPLWRAYPFTFMLSHHPLIKKHQLESTAVICIHYY